MDGRHNHVLYPSPILELILMPDPLVGGGRVRGGLGVYLGCDVGDGLVLVFKKFPQITKWLDPFFI
jgi:hypothetical protein